MAASDLFGVFILTLLVAMMVASVADMWWWS